MTASTGGGLPAGTRVEMAKEPSGASVAFTSKRPFFVSDVRTHAAVSQRLLQETKVESLHFEPVVREACESGRYNGIVLLGGGDPGYVEGREIAHRYGAWDDFEDQPLHATYLIDRDGKVRWHRISADPFRDFAFLKEELARVNRLTAK